MGVLGLFWGVCYGSRCNGYTGKKVDVTWVNMAIILRISSAGYICYIMRGVMLYVRVHTRTRAHAHTHGGLCSRG